MAPFACSVGTTTRSNGSPTNRRCSRCLLPSSGSRETGDARAEKQHGRGFRNGLGIREVKPQELSAIVRPLPAGGGAERHVSRAGAFPPREDSAAAVEFHARH